MLSERHLNHILYIYWKKWLPHPLSFPCIFQHHLLQV
uniref:Uncharacterized protein n=1 Tax=Arundo donax TaxID=35708 RepID=A0A0A9FCC6_ARUDO